MSIETHHPDFEVFLDESYFDMWAVRPVGVRDYNSTIHFTTEAHANHATHAINSWMEHLK